MQSFRREIFHVKHLEIMEIRNLEKESIMQNSKILEGLQIHSGKMDAITLIHEGRIIACMGFMEILPGIADVWLIPSIYVPKVPKLFLREVRQYLDAVIEALGFHRLQTVGRTDAYHTRWMEYLGFTCEGTMKNYHQKQDYYMWART